LAKLNDKQQESVNYVDGPLLVLAGAGSGKTSVITRKIAHLITNKGMSARNIAALTFTNKAAREMKERVTGLLNSDLTKGLTVSTFHNLGLNIIRREHKALGMKANFSIFDASDALNLIKELLMRGGELDTSFAELIQSQISNWKNDMVSPDAALATAESTSEQTIARVFEGYERALKAYNAVDFDDLILRPTQLFESNPDVLERWQNKIRYLLVDEYQDTNLSQYLLVKQLVGVMGRITVVGDDDQSIYAWRGARPENLSQLKVDFPSLKLIKLEQNYRSTGRILKAANHLIAHNPHDFEKALWSAMEFGDPIRITGCKNEEAETERVAVEILDRRLRHGLRFGDFAVLYRGNHQAKLLELKLQHHQIPYKMSGGTSFFDRAEIKDVIAYLRLLTNSDDDNAFLRIINTPRRKIGASTLESLGIYATEVDKSLFEAIDDVGLTPLIAPESLKRLRQFRMWLDALKARSFNISPDQLIEEMLDDVEYEAWLHQNTSAAKVAEGRMNNIRQLINSVSNTVATLDESDDPLADAVSKLLLRDMLDRQQEDEDDYDQVQLMTLHASKGLEFNHVYLIGAEEEILPHRTSIEEDNIEEERRLAYVGITRAKRTLSISYAQTRKQYGERVSCVPSRFLEELPEEDLVWEGVDAQPNEQANIEAGTQTLASLKAMFD